MTSEVYVLKVTQREGKTAFMMKVNIIVERE